MTITFFQKRGRNNLLTQNICIKVTRTQLIVQYAECQSELLSCQLWHQKNAMQLIIFQDKMSACDWESILIYQNNIL